MDHDRRGTQDLAGTLLKTTKNQTNRGPQTIPNDQKETLTPEPLEGERPTIHLQSLQEKYASTQVRKVISKVLPQSQYLNGRRQTGLINSSTNLKKSAPSLNN